MAYKSTRQKQTDPNAESRVNPPVAAPVMAPAAPYVQNPAGGAPKLKSTYAGLPASASPSSGVPTSPFTPAAPRQNVWQGQPSPTTPTSSITAPTWSLKDVAAAEPQVTKQIQDMLWQKFQSAPEQDRNGVFWQGVKQNPQLAAASFVRRMLDNMKNANDLMNGVAPPTLSAAASATMANSETRQWLDWVRGNRKVMPRGGV